MRLSLHSDYALRILMALSASGRQMSVDEIAGQYGISRNHLAKVAQRLQGLGYVSAQRGRGGGLTLAREPGEVGVGTGVRQFENLDGLVECMTPATRSEERSWRERVCQYVSISVGAVASKKK